MLRNALGPMEETAWFCFQEKPAKVIMVKAFVAVFTLTMNEFCGSGPVPGLECVLDVRKRRLDDESTFFE